MKVSSIQFWIQWICTCFSHKKKHRVSVEVALDDFALLLSFLFIFQKLWVCVFTKLVHILLRSREDFNSKFKRNKFRERGWIALSTKKTTNWKKERFVPRFFRGTVNVQKESFFFMKRRREDLKFKYPRYFGILPKTIN